ncbi:hypothetical protein HNP40_002850 [Mycobacteroides chelonae]|nr:hypothetical protein [Mycobacteroides chelonae]
MGNFDEAKAIGPNIAGDSKAQLKAFQQFTTRQPAIAV